MTEITPQGLAEKRRGENGGPVVLDIRPSDEFEDWHIPGSDNLEIYEDLKEGRSGSTIDILRDLPRDEEYVTVCAAGVVSQTATEILRDLGYDASTLVDGMEGWSRVHRHEPVDVTIDGTLVQMARPGKGCLSYALVSAGEAVVFDASQYLEPYESVLDEYDARLIGVFDTHAHADHVSGGTMLAEQQSAPYHLHPDDAIHIESEPVADGQVFTVGDVEIEVIHTPGHSPGGVTYDIGNAALLTGDTLFHESVGRVELGVEAGIENTDVAENAAMLYESLQRLLDRDADPLVLPAHDPGAPEPPVAARLGEIFDRNEDLRRTRQSFIAKLSADIPDHPPNFQQVKRVNIGAEELPEDELASLESGPNRCAAE